MGRTAEAPRTDIPLSDEANAAGIGVGAPELGSGAPQDTSAAENAAARVLARHGLDPDGGGDLTADDDTSDIGRAPAGRHPDDVNFDGEGEADDAPPPSRSGVRRAEDNAPADADASTAPPELLLVGQAMGWTDQEVAEHIESVGLERATRDFDRYSRSLAAFPGGQVPGQPGAIPSGTPGQAPAGAPAPSGQSQPPPVRGLQLLQPFTDAEIKQARDDWGDAFVDKVMLPQRQHALAMQEEIVAHRMERAQAQEREAHAVFDQLAQGGAALYGNSRRITPQHAEFQARRQTYGIAERIFATAQQAGRPIHMRQAILQAHIALNPQAITTQAHRRVQEQVISRHRQTSIPPGVPAGGRTRRPSPEQAAAAAIVAVHRKHGLTVPQE